MLYAGNNEALPHAAGKLHPSVHTNCYDYKTLSLCLPQRHIRSDSPWTSWSGLPIAARRRPRCNFRSTTHGRFPANVCFRLHNCALIVPLGRVADIIFHIRTTFWHTSLVPYEQCLFCILPYALNATWLPTRLMWGPYEDESNGSTSSSETMSIHLIYSLFHLA